jgi:hypothetical protein
VGSINRKKTPSSSNGYYGYYIKPLLWLLHQTVTMVITSNRYYGYYIKPLLWLLHQTVTMVITSNRYYGYCTIIQDEHKVDQTTEITIKFIH